MSKNNFLTGKKGIIDFLKESDTKLEFANDISSKNRKINKVMQNVQKEKADVTT